MFGLSPADHAFIHSVLVHPLQMAGATVWIFGSRARGDHKKFSDLDVLYEMKSGYVLPAGFLSKIKEQLEESNLAVKVDVVDIADLAESYRANVLRDRAAWR